MSTKAQLVEPESFTGIVEFNEFEANLAEYKSRYEGVVYDLTDSDQEKRAKSDRLAIGKTIASLDRVHKDVKSPLKAQVDLLDGERKRIKDGLLDIQGSIKSQIAEHEANIEAKEQELLARVEDIKSLAFFDGLNPDSALIEFRISDLTDMIIDASFEHYEAEATFAKVKALEYLQGFLVDVKKQEADAAELARLKKEQAAREQKEREDRIAAEAKARAEKDAEESIERERQAKIEAEKAAIAAKDQAEQAAKAAAKQAEKDKKEASKLAKEAQAEAVRQAEEKAKREAEAKEHAEQARIAAEKAAQEKREANKRHRGKINSAAVAELIAASGITPDQAKACVIAIAKNEIPAVSIHY